MPAELLEVLHFGTAILAGGIVAVISSVLAFSYARRLQRAEAEGRRRDLRRALVSEIRENMRRLGGPVVAQVPSAVIVRSAWDSARAMPFGDEVFDAIAAAYAHGAEMDQWIALILGRMSTRGVVARWSSEYRARKGSIAMAQERAQATYDSFAAALKLLEAS
jgi:hypothetical protein